MRWAILILLCPLTAASAVAQSGGPTLDQALRQAESEQHDAEAQTARLEHAASRARGDVERLHAQQAAAAQAIDAAEARITAADTRFRLASAYVAAHRQRLAAEQQPVSALLAGLAVMAQRPPLLAVADRGGTDELVKVRVLLDATLPVIRARTGALAAQVDQGKRLQQAAASARRELAGSRDNLVARRREFASLEARAAQQALASSSQALGSGDAALAAGENVARLRSEQSSGSSVRAMAAQLAAEGPAPVSPFAPSGRDARPPLAYMLPADAPVTEGLAAVSDSGVRSRGLTLATWRGAPLVAPADGIVRFAGPFRSYDGVLILDHGNGWLSLLVNLTSQLRTGDRIRIGEPVGRALGPLQVELSQNGRRISPALIAGSSASLSKLPKGG